MAYADNLSKDNLEIYNVIKYTLPNLNIKYEEKIDGIKFTYKDYKFKVVLSEYGGELIIASIYGANVVCSLKHMYNKHDIDGFILRGIERHIALKEKKKKNKEELKTARETVNLFSFTENILIENNIKYYMSTEGYKVNNRRLTLASYIVSISFTIMEDNELLFARIGSEAFFLPIKHTDPIFKETILGLYEILIKIPEEKVNKLLPPKVK